MTPGATPALSRAPRAVFPAVRAVPLGLYQRCSRCGTDEYGGGYCTWCRWESYTLVYHRHKAEAGACPLGPYLNPSSPRNHPPSSQAALARDREAWLASPAAREAESYVVGELHHPASAS